MTEDRKSFSCAGRASWMMIASFAINLFLIGVIVGPLLGSAGPERDRRAQDFPRPPGGPGFIFDHMASDLPPEEAAKLRAIFDEERSGLRNQHKGMRESLRQVADIMKADKPDLAALHKALAEIRSHGEGLHKGMARALERVITELSAESRRKIAEKMAALPPPPPPGEGPRHHPQNGPEKGRDAFR